MTLIAILLSILFALIGALHIYWGLGGSWGASDALPKKENGELVFAPCKAGCFIVAIGLLSLAWLCLAQVALVPAPLALTPKTLRLLCLSLAAIFTLRAIGDFRYVGFFRRVWHTDFGRMEGRIFAPLCLMLGLGLLLLGLN